MELLKHISLGLGNIISQREYVYIYSSWTVHSDTLVLLFLGTGHSLPRPLFSRQEYWSGLPVPSPGESSQPRDWTLVSCIAGRHFNLWATREVLSGPMTCLGADPVTKVACVFWSVLSPLSHFPKHCKVGGWGLSGRLYFPGSLI